MTVFEWWQFKELRQMHNSKKPNNATQFHEMDSSTKLFFVDSTNTDIWLKTEDEGVTVSESADAGSTIYRTCPDFPNGIIYFNRAGSSAVKSDLCKLTIATDTISQHWADLWQIHDVILDPNGSIYTVQIWYAAGGGDDHIHGMLDEVAVWGVSSADSGTQTFRAEPDLSGITWEISFLVSTAPNTFYYLIKFSDENVKLYKHIRTGVGSGTLTELEDCGASTDLPASEDLRGISYDGSDTLYFILDVSGTNYLYSYAITSDTLTQLSQLDVSLMLDRNTHGDSPSPFEFEKGFHLTSSFIYQIARGYGSLLKLQDIKLTGGETIIAISDKYAITSTPDLYKYTESIAELHTARASYQTHRAPKGRFSHTEQLSTDVVIEIWEKKGE